MQQKPGISYVRIMIIVLVLGITAKIVVPQFTEATTEKKISILIDGLEAMRANIDLYCIQNEGRLPTADSSKTFKAAMMAMAQWHGVSFKDIPVNPFNNSNRVRFDEKQAGAGLAGWRFDTKTGLFQADNNAECAAL